MAYEYIIMTENSHCEELRTIMGVNSDELSDVQINMLPILPAAEMAIIKLQPTAYTPALPDLTLATLQLAILYEAAANAIPGVKARALRTETDNKTTAQRFDDAFSTEADGYRALSKRYLEEVDAQLGIVGTKDSLLSIVKPSVDVITGTSYA